MNSSKLGWAGSVRCAQGGGILAWLLWWLPHVVFHRRETRKDPKLVEAVASAGPS